MSGYHLGNYDDGFLRRHDTAESEYIRDCIDCGREYSCDRAGMLTAKGRCNDCHLTECECGSVQPRHEMVDCDDDVMCARCAETWHRTCPYCFMIYDTTADLALHMRDCTDRFGDDLDGGW